MEIIREVEFFANADPRIAVVIGFTADGTPCGKQWRKKVVRGYSYRDRNMDKDSWRGIELEDCYNHVPDQISWEWWWEKLEPEEFFCLANPAATVSPWYREYLVYAQTIVALLAEPWAKAIPNDIPMWGCEVLPADNGKWAEKAAQAKAKLATIRQVEPLARFLTEKVEAGEILLKLTNHYRSKQEVLVIRPDGTKREGRRTKPGWRGRDWEDCWDVVYHEELAMVRGHHSNWFKMPVSGKLTAAQTAFVEKYEDQWGLRRGWLGLHPELNKLWAERVKAILERIAPLGVDQFEMVDSLEEVDYRQLANDNGLTVVCPPSSLLRHSGQYTTRCANRDGEVTHSLKAPGGVIEFVIYHKFGNWNLNLRFIEQAELEPVAEPKSLAASLEKLKDAWS